MASATTTTAAGSGSSKQLTHLQQYASESEVKQRGDLAELAAWTHQQALSLAAKLDTAEAAIVNNHRRWNYTESTFCGLPVVLEYSAYQDSDRLVQFEIEKVWLRGVFFEPGDQEITQEQFDLWADACKKAEGWQYADDFDAPDTSDDFDGSAAAAAEDRYIAQRDHAHYARAA